MTLTTSVAGIDYDGDGADVSFPTTFYFQSNSNVVVSEVDSEGTETPKYEGVHYSLTGAGAAGGGTVTMIAAPAVGMTLRIRRVIPLTQPTAFSSLGTFSPAIHEAAFDRATMQAQQVYSEAVDSVADLRAEVLALRADIAADPDAAALDARTVVATGSTEARSLADRFADLQCSVLDFHAVGDGVTDDTAAIEAAIAALPAEGGQVVFPEGIFKCNLTITRKNIHLVGTCRSISESTTPVPATVLRPYSLLAPCVQFGDGTTVVRGGGIRDLTLHGTYNLGAIAGTNTASDGLYIYGASELDFTRLSVENFEGDNVRIASSATRPCQFNNFSYFSSFYSSKSCLRLEYGASYVTAQFFSHFVLGGWQITGAYALYMDQVVAYFSDGWIEAGDAKGHIKLVPGANACRLHAHNVAVDSIDPTYVLLEIGASPGALSSHVRGTLTVDGKAKWASGSALSIADIDLMASKPNFYGPTVLNSLYFADGNSATPEYTTDSDVKIYRGGSDPNQLLTFGTKLALKLNATYQKPTFMGTSALWKDANEMLRFYPGNNGWPASDTVANSYPLSMKVGVPASAAASGTPGMWAADTSYIYICVATDTWMRAAIATW